MPQFYILKRRQVEDGITSLVRQVTGSNCIQFNCFDWALGYLGIPILHYNYLILKIKYNIIKLRHYVYYYISNIYVQ